MIGAFDPVKTAGDITTTYRRYLQSLLPISEPKLRDALQREIATAPLLHKGPLLEATPPYAPASSIRDLINDGVLSPHFADLASAALPLDRPLYAHQDSAIRKVASGRNLLVATGTGSGKTESFLLPIIDSLVRERESGTLGPGVRALLLYPMNALANDQMKRLRGVLSGYPAITFGRYTGDTETDPSKARDSFDELNPGQPRLKNEILSRNEMQAAPPHILLTNYAMLEYLLLRPADLDLFEGQYADTWKFIVVDEAHVYDGTQGAEVAMLLRRLRDRVAPDRPLRCIATSATVGTDTGPEAVVRFASQLFGEPFEWVDGERDRQDLVTATRVLSPLAGSWGPLSASDYIRLRAATNRAGAILEVARARGWEGSDSAAAIDNETRLADLRRHLNGPRGFAGLAQQVFPDDLDAAAGLEALVDVASAVRHADGTAPLSARYHLFLRATEGAFACLSGDDPHVYLARRDQCDRCEGRVFEIASCRRCGAVHLVGHVEGGAKEPVFRPRSATQIPTWLVLDADAEVTDDDDVALDDGPGNTTGDDAYLCAGCGTLRSTATAGCTTSDCHGGRVMKVRRLKQKGADVTGCIMCGARGASTVRMFDSGPDASGAVIATELYQQLAPGDETSGIELPGGGRKLLMFSDSRQAAAYFAPYLQTSYDRLQRRRLIMQGLMAGREGEESAVEDVVFSTRKFAEQAGVFPRRQSSQQQERVVAPWVMAEVVATDDRQSLEGLGLITVRLLREASWAAPRPILDLGLDEEQAWSLLEELVRSLRQQGAVTMPETVPPNSEIFAPRLGPIYVRQSGPEAIRKVLSWLPGRGTNRRIDYLQRVLDQLGSSADPAQLLEGAWRFLSTLPYGWLSSTTHQGLGTVFQVDHEALRIARPGPGNQIFACSRCRRVAANSVLGVCPALKCDGTLESFADKADVGNTHYRAMYQTMNPVPLSAHEHTAQLKNTEAAKVQQQFIHGVTNALSCSTTFELGVDVGELQSVLLRNMPPTTANYVQRAGRAGRRSDSAALVVTFAQRRSHDLTRYDKPEAMIAGKMRTPYVPLENERIDRRHAHSVALSAFFRWLSEDRHMTLRTAGEFFLSEGPRPAVHTMVRDYLDPVPPRVAESLRRVLPAAVQGHLGLSSNRWVSELGSLLDRIAAELESDIALLTERVETASAAKQFFLANRFQQVIKTVRSRELLGFLAARNVLPKYGFPVDSVELRTQYSTAEHNAGATLELSRDLSVAIYEYAPGSQLVAGGQLWTSGGIYRLPGKELESASYLICVGCDHYWESASDVDPQCPVCGQIPTSAPRTHVVPEFGFVAAHDVDKPGMTPPRRSWAGGTHVLRLSDEPRSGQLVFEGGVVDTQVGPRGRLIALSEGRNQMGFWVCQWCGWGDQRANRPKAPRSHKHLLKNADCTGPLQMLSLAHRYETDILRLDLVLPTEDFHPETWLSVLYALLEGASERLEIARDDIDGALVPTGPHSHALVLFDRVPGGAGNVLRIEAQLTDVLDAALARVATCECGPETSCYGCLRSFGNQRDHDKLSRGRAEIALSTLLGQGRAFGTPSAAGDLSAAWAALHSAAITGPERDLVSQLSAAGAPLPAQGYELPDGTPADLAWPELRIAVVSCPLDGPVPAWTCVDLEGGDVADQLLALLAIGERE